MQHYIKIRPSPERPWAATVWRDLEAGPLSQGARYLGQLRLRGERHYVIPPGEEEPTYWYFQLTAALQYLATGEPGEAARKVVIARAETPAPVGGLEHGNSPSFRSAHDALADWRHTKGVYADNLNGRAPE